MTTWNKRLQASFDSDSIPFAIASNFLFVSDEQANAILDGTRCYARIQYPKAITVPQGCTLSKRQFKEMNNL